VEVIRAHAVDVEKLIKMLVANAAAEFASTYYYYTILRMNLAGYEDYKEICEDARLEDRAHWELIVPRIYELGGSLPNDLREFHDQAGCPAAKLPDPPTVVDPDIAAGVRALRDPQLERRLRQDVRKGSENLRPGRKNSFRGNRA
jgi:ferritin-like protein